MTLSNLSRYFIVVAAFLGAVAVSLGAYASHGLSTWATASQISQLQLGVQYQLFHAIVLLCVSILNSTLTQSKFTQRLLSMSLWCFSIGILCFSGSLYYLVFTASKSLVLITPIGGLLLILGWVFLGVSMLFNNKK